jgi:3-oxoadipate enol-lactonase
MQFAEINGITIHYRVDGSPDAPAIVFSNSLGTDLRIWDEVAARFAEKWRVIRYDKRGHGLSDVPAPPCRMRHHIDDLDALLDFLKVGKTVVVGLSIGGMIAIGLAAKRPDRVRALVLCASLHKIGTDELWNGRIAAIEKGGIAAISDGILERWFSADFRRDERVAFAGYRNMLERTPCAGYLGSAAAIRDTDYTREVGAIVAPTLLIVGSNDLTTPPEAVRSAHELIAGSQFEIIDGPGHLPCIERPEKTVSLIAGFLEENGIGRPD